MDKYIVMAEIVKQVLESWQLMLLAPACILCWKLPGIIEAVKK